MAGIPLTIAGGDVGLQRDAMVLGPAGSPAAPHGAPVKIPQPAF